MTLALSLVENTTSFFGIVKAIATLIETERYNINEDFSSCAPLAWAARNGHGEAAKILLERECQLR